MDSPLAAVVFYAFSALAIGLALVTVLAKNIFRSALALTGTLSAIAGFFILVGADFLAASQVLVYVGGIMIILLFVVMLSQQPLEKLSRQTNAQWLLGALVAVTILAALGVRLQHSFSGVTASSEFQPTTAALGRLILLDWAVPFEVISLVLLAALVGAVLFSQAQDSKEKDG